MSGERVWWPPLDPERRYTTSSWFITVNTNKNTEEGRQQALKIKDFFSSDAIELIRVRDIQTGEFTRPVTQSAVHGINIAIAEEVSRDGRFHLHFDIDCIVVKPHRIAIPYDRARAILNELVDQKEGESIYFNAKLYINNKLRIEMYMSKQRHGVEYTENVNPDIPS